MLASRPLCVIILGSLALIGFVEGGELSRIQSLKVVSQTSASLSTGI